MRQLIICTICKKKFITTAKRLPKNCWKCRKEKTNKAQKEKANKAHREDYKKHREARLKYQKEYDLKHRPPRKPREARKPRKTYEEIKEQMRIYSKEYYQKNKEKISEYRRKNRKNMNILKYEKILMNGLNMPNNIIKK